MAAREMDCPFFGPWPFTSAGPKRSVEAVTRVARILENAEVTGQDHERSEQMCPSAEALNADGNRGRGPSRQEGEPRPKQQESPAEIGEASVAGDGLDGRLSRRWDGRTDRHAK